MDVMKNIARSIEPTNENPTSQTGKILNPHSQP